MKRQTDTQRNEERDKQADKKKTVTQSAKLRVRQSSKRPSAPHIVKGSPSQANYHFLIQANSLIEKSINQSN